MPTLTTRRQRAAAERRRNSWKVALALLGALGLHLVLLPIIVWVAAHWPRTPLKGVPPRAPLQLTILPPTDAPPARPSEPAAPYMRTTEEQQADKKVEDPNFISDHDTLAASEQPATGDQPLPSQEGRKSDAFEFNNTNYRPGPTPSEAASAAPAAAAQKKDEEGKQNDAPAPAATPLPSKHRAPRQKSDAISSPDGALAAAEPTASPEPPAPTPEKAEDLATNVPPPDKQMQSRTAPSNQSNPSIVPNPGLPKKPGYQPMTRQTVYKGNINNRGKPAVQAKGNAARPSISRTSRTTVGCAVVPTDERWDGRVVSVGQDVGPLLRGQFRTSAPGASVSKRIEHERALGGISMGSVHGRGHSTYPPAGARRIAGRTRWRWNWTSSSWSNPGRRRPGESEFQPGNSERFERMTFALPPVLANAFF